MSLYQTTEKYLTITVKYLTFEKSIYLGVSMRLEKKIEQLRKEIYEFRTETRQRLELIENNVRKQISSNYIRAIFEYVNRTTLDITKCLNCQKNREIELVCKENMISTQQNYIDLLKNGNLSESLVALEEAIAVFSKRMEDMVNRGNIGCGECFRNEIEMMETNRSFLTHLQELQSPSANTAGNWRVVSVIDPSEIEMNVLNPISHKARLEILLSIFKGENRFGDFVGITGLNGGHLLYHLKRLLEHSFIQQYASKDYVLTRKGLKTVNLLMQLNHELRENE
jgi:predicted transcriptional regulator